MNLDAAREAASVECQEWTIATLRRLLGSRALTVDMLNEANARGYSVKFIINEPAARCDTLRIEKDGSVIESTQIVKPIRRSCAN